MTTNPPFVLLGSLRTQARNIQEQFGHDGMPPETTRFVQTFLELDRKLKNGDPLPTDWRKPHGRCGTREHAQDLRRWVQRIGLDLEAAQATVGRLDADLKELEGKDHA